MRSIPAWAGEPSHVYGASGLSKVYPRVGGGTGRRAISITIANGLSPRGRGNRCVLSLGRTFVGSIPAWAGEPQEEQPDTHEHEVYPRVGGGTAVAAYPLQMWRGLSPRGRGNQRPPMVEMLKNRSIPAWAGEPSGPGLNTV